MKSNILVVNSTATNIDPLLNIFLGLSDFKFYFYLTNKHKLYEKNFYTKKIFLNPIAKNKITTILFFVVFPVLLIKSVFSLINAKSRLKIRTIILFGFNEKLLFTPIAKLLKIKTIWIEVPRKKIHTNCFLLKKLSNFSEIITFTTKQKLDLKKYGYNEKNISTIPIGIKQKESPLQENLFLNIAKNHQENTNKKYFTIGTILSSKKQNQLENIFVSMKKCVDVVDDIQLIIVGDASERKKIMWLAKRIGVENIVWFVGDNDGLKKWFNGFDVFISNNEKCELAEIKIILTAMMNSLPIICFDKRDMDDFIINKKTGFLINKNNTELLSQKVIELYKNKLLIYRYGKNGFDSVKKKFNLENILKKWNNILCK